MLSKRKYIPVQQFKQDFDDDPVKLMSLPLSEKTSEFWKRYDRQADIHDTKMTDDLGENLDVLLIFAALFSAINTAFISLTMPGLSSDPQTETNTLLRLLVTRADNSTLGPADLSPPFAPSSNSIVVNCLLYASLSCSLLASVGAMMAKEWLQSFDRTGQTGPLEEQGRYRQRKFNGVQQWHLESIIRSLPNVLMLSVILFFAGICLFLFPVNKAVAGVVIAFSGIGAVFCGIAIVAGAISPLCPYQSAASRAVKRMGLLFSRRWWTDLGRAVVKIVVHRLPKIVRKIFDAIHHYPSIASAIVGPMSVGLVPTPPGEDVISEQVAITEAARWLVQTTSSHGDQIAAAQFISTLGNPACVMILGDPKIWRQFLSLTQEVFDVWHSQSTEMIQETAELFGLTLCHVLHPSKDPVKMNDLTDSRLYQSGFGGTFLRALEFALTRYSRHKSEDKEMILHIAFLLAITSRGQTISQDQWTGLSRFFLTRKILHFAKTLHFADDLLGLWAKMFCGMDPAFNRPHAFLELVDEGDNKIVLPRHLSNALICGTRVLSLVRGNLQSESQAVRVYRACLQRAAQFTTQIRGTELTNVINGVADFIVSYVDPLISSKSGETSPELVRVSIEAVLALHAFIDNNARRDQIRVCWDAGTDQLGNEYVINAAVHIMLDKFRNLSSSALLPILSRARERERAGRRAERPAERLAERLTERLAERLAKRLTERLEDQLKDRLPHGGGLGLATEQAGELLEGLADGLADELADGLADGLANELVDELGGELEGELEGELAAELAAGLVSQLDDKVRHTDLLWSRLYSGLAGRLRFRLVSRLAEHLASGLAARLAAWLAARALKIAKDLAQRLRVESSILRIVLCAWRRTPGQLEHSERREIFISSCRLWAPLETRVDFTINGIEWGVNGERLTFDEGDRQNLLTPDERNEIVEFAEDIQKDRKKSEFIARGADVGINRLYVHFNRRVDWNYDLYDLREQHMWCPRSIGKGAGMIL